MVKHQFRSSCFVLKTLSRVCWFCMLFLLSIPLKAIDYTIPYYPWKIDTCDINNDGYRDLIIMATGGLGYMQNNGDGTFAPYVIIVPGDVHIVACSQLDETPGDDIVVLRCYSGDEPIQFEYYFNGNFTQPNVVPFPNNMTVHSSYNHAYGDFNNDSREDIVLNGFVDPITNHKFWCYMYNLGNQQFSVPVFVQSLPSAYGSIVVGSFNEDQFDDIAFTCSSIQIQYSTGNGFYRYEAHPPCVCGGLVAVDFDQDGDLDLITNSWDGGWTNHHRYLENIQGLSFIPHSQLYQHNWGDLHSEDLDGDGYPDIVSVSGWSIAIYRNLRNWTTELASLITTSHGENTRRICLDRFDINNTYDMAIIRDTATQNNLTILYNNGYGVFVDSLVVSAQDEVLPSPSNKIICFPNPCRESITFKIDKDTSGSVYTIFNTRGQFVRQLVSQGQEMNWDLTDKAGLRVKSGIYLIRQDSSIANIISKFIVLH